MSDQEKQLDILRLVIAIFLPPLAVFLQVGLPLYEALLSYLNSF